MSNPPIFSNRKYKDVLDEIVNNPVFEGLNNHENDIKIGNRPVFEIVLVRCPTCHKKQYYMYREIIVCDYCVSDIPTDKCIIKVVGK